MSDASEIAVAHDRRRDPARLALVLALVRGLLSNAGVRNLTIAICIGAASALVGAACGGSNPQSPVAADAAGVDAGVDASSATCLAVSPGHLDPGFADGGALSVLFGPGSTGSQANGVVIQPDGKPVIDGTFSSQTAPLGGMVLARYTTAGVLDPTFGAGAGYVTTTTMNGGGAIASLPSGAILAAGYEKKSGMLVQRYSPAGDLDTTFGSSGTTVLSFSLGEPWVSRLVVQPSGAIVVFGTVGDGQNYRVAMARLDASGALDPSFGQSGQMLLGFLGGNTFSSGLAVGSDGALIGTATADDSAATPASHHVVFKMSADGQLDGTFGTAGVVDLGDGEPGGVALTGDGAIVADGVRNGQFAVVRLLSTGVVDDSFGVAGWTSIFDQGSRAWDVAIDRDGTIVAAGDGGLGMAWARLTPAGALDPTFANGGTGSAPLGSAAVALALAPGCSAVVVGSQSAQTEISLTIARFAL
jgi:uncharacterized delta-60 repeat protein